MDDDERSLRIFFLPSLVEILLEWLDGLLEILGLILVLFLVSTVKGAVLVPFTCPGRGFLAIVFGGDVTRRSS